MQIVDRIANKVFQLIFNDGSEKYTHLSVRKRLLHDLRGDWVLGISVHHQKVGFKIKEKNGS